MSSKLSPQTIQNILWGLFLVYYFAAKYFVGGFTGFSWPYLFSVIVLVGLTAAGPYYLARFAVGKLQGALKWAGLLTLPTLLTAAGLSLYFLTVIQPNYETIKLPAIIHRAIMPGVAISLLLLLGGLLAHRARPASEG